MENDTASGGRARPGLFSRWPITTVAALTGVISLGVLVAIGPPMPEARTIGGAIEVDEEAPGEEAPRAETKAERHRGEEGKMGKPTSKSGLYAMKGPKGGAAAAGDADVWGGLSGTEIGEAYGVGGLGLVGTGRGGGGTGEGTIGYGGGGMRRAATTSHYDRSIQAGTLTAGTIDDNADPAGYRKALRKLAEAREGLKISEELWHTAPPKQRHDETPANLDIALVIDTTGSMGDELEYLKVELREIAEEVARDYPGVEQRWGLVAYRDDGDDYVTRDFDFRDIDGFVHALGCQRSDGGGDTPEAMELGVAASRGLAWRDAADTARMVFLVADAPTHPGAPARKFAAEVLEYRAAGTAIYPVAGSGVDPQAEAELRFAAKATGGQYIYLTDHSGVGDAHAKPVVDQIKVEPLRAAMQRMIRGELGKARAAAGENDPPAPRKRAPARCEDDAPAVVPVPVPVDAEPARPVFVPVVPEPEPVALATDAGLWDELKARLAAHLLFASTMAVLMLAAIGFDTLMRRRSGRR